MSYKADIRLSFGGIQTLAPGVPSGAPARLPRDVEYLLALAAGTGVLQVDAIFADTYTIVAGNVEILELDALVDPVGGAISFSKIKAICIKERLAASGYFTVGGGTGGSTAPNADAWSDTDAGVIGSPFDVDGSFSRYEYGGAMVWVSPQAGVSVVNTTAQMLGIEAFVADQTVDVWIAGLD